MIYWNHTPKALELMQPFLTDIISANQTPVNSWILREANALVNSVKDSETKDPQAILPSLIKLKDRWDFVLSEIKAITNPTTGDNADTNVSESNIRLTWRFDGHNFEPYEQTRKNNSTAWSKGRKVALVRLFYDWQERNYLSEADRAICKSLKKECYYNGYGHCDICCIPFNAYKYFIGHPLIFSDKVPMQRVEIIEGKPILEITNKKDQSCIKLNPYPRVESKYEKDEDNDELNTDLEKAVGDQLIRISQYRFQLVHFDNVQLKIANLLTKKGLFVPKGREQETAEILKPLLASFSVQMDSSNADMVGHITTVEEVEPDSRIHLHIIPEGDLLSVEMLVYPLGEMCDSYAPSYGVERLLTTRIDKQMGTKRDFMQEQGNLKMVIDACPSLARAVQKNYRYTFEEPLSSFEFLSQLEALASEYRTFDDFKIHSEKTKKATRKTTKKDQSEEIVESETPVETTDELYRQDSPLIIKWPQGHRIRVSSPVSFSNLRLSITSSKNWFEASGSLNVQGHEIELAELLLSLKESNTRFIQMKKGEYLALSEEFKKKLDEFGYYSSRQGKKIRIHPLATQAIDQVFEDVTHNLGSMKITSQWKECRKRFQEAENLEIKVPKTFQGTLRDYQLEGVQWLGRLAAWGAGGCLADDMGLGKTIQAIVLLLLRANEGPALVVAPTSVCSNWESELNRFAPSLNVKRVSSYVECSTVNRKERVDIIADAKPRDIFITNYSILQIEREAFAKQKYSTIILDEAQAIKNFQTERTQAALTLQGDFRMITTGTPIENHLGELWTLFEFINPGFLGAQKSFDNRFAIPIQRDGDARTKLNLKKLVRPFLLRRFKSDVLQELPGRTDITLEVELSKEEAVLYEVIRRKAVENMEKLNGEKAGKQHLQILAELMRLRRMCCHSKLVLPESDIKCSKLELLGDTVRELLENNHKALIFSQFTDYLKLIAKKMDEMGVTYRYLDGSMSQKKRQVEVDAFQAGESDVFLISLKAGGFGLNLTAADYVIHMDPWWNPAVENQAADRAHRYGQQRPVTVYRMITKGTIEEKIVDLHQRKEKLAQDILDGSDTPAKISLDELMDILKEK